MAGSADRVESQFTGIHFDAWLNQHPLMREEDKVPVTPLSEVHIVRYLGGGKHFTLGEMAQAVSEHLPHAHESNIEPIPESARPMVLSAAH